MLVTALLKKYGHRVDVVSNGAEAITSVRQIPYDLVLMDIQMPEMDGVEATKKIRELGPETDHLPIIAMTANAMLGDRESYLDAGMNDYIEKPINENKLIETIEKWTTELGDDASDEDDPRTEQATVATVTSIVDPEVMARWESMLGRVELGELIDKQVDNAASRIEQVKNAVAEGMFDDVRAIAHDLKSTCGSFGLHRVQELAQELEHACREGRTDDARGLVPKVADAISEANSALKLHMAS